MLADELSSQHGLRAGWDQDICFLSCNSYLLDHKFAIALPASGYWIDIYGKLLYTHYIINSTVSTIRLFLTFTWPNSLAARIDCLANTVNTPHVFLTVTQFLLAVGPSFRIAAVLLP